MLNASTEAEVNSAVYRLIVQSPVEVVYLRMLDARLFLISACFAFSSATRLCMICAYSFYDPISNRSQNKIETVVLLTAASLLDSARRRLSAIL